MNGNKGGCVLFFFFYLSICAQKVEQEIEKKGEKPEKDSIEIYKPIPEDYLYSNGEQAIEVLDTPLSLEKYYKHNFLRKDYFGFIAFSNMGRPLNPLLYRPKSRLLPDMGFSAKQYPLISSDEVRYFDVKTPITELFYESGMDQGQMLQALFTQSPRKRMNYSLQYSGLRSLGYYSRELSVGHIYLATFNYKTPEECYKLWIHFFDQDINNQENGGIQDIQGFRDNRPEFKNRKNIPVNLSEAESRFRAKRYYLKHSWALFPSIKENISFCHPFVLKHEFHFETKNHLYREKKEQNFFRSKVYPGEARLDKADYEHLGNELTLALKREKWHLEGGLHHDHLAYRLPLGGRTYPSKIQTDVLSLRAGLQYHYDRKWLFKADGLYALSGKFARDFLFNARAEIPVLEKIKCRLQASLSTTHPDFNTMLHRSFYENYNYSFLDFKAVDSRSLHVYLLSEKYLDLYFNLYDVGWYTYFNQSAYPSQYDQRMKLFDIQTRSVIKFGKFALENHLQYQRVTSGNEVLLLPDFIARASLYYEDVFFEKSLSLQTGVSLNYFSKFRSAEFFPVLNEFVLPSSGEVQPIGGYPFLDYFLNFKVFRMQFYIRAQHFSARLGNHNYFSAPAYPSTDFILRLGLLWNLLT
ncbi:putative porin [Bacteroidetes bacterium endosymbiont of Geopemphigus sp.]|uniref:putative porin n=1 Tax=Bacteroidetes bacterium endosymbiont of Geopemphigus sp. TaxID=2047937 RepID=UPI000CD0F1D1|nr:putative porin [Bacteroidetes bacterium endosymbiont of Geopemphigus sp.]